MKQYKIDLRYFNSLIVPLPQGLNLTPLIYLYNQFDDGEEMSCGFEYFNAQGEKLGEEGMYLKFHKAGNALKPKGIPKETASIFCYAVPTNTQLREKLESLEAEKIFNHVYSHSNSVNYQFSNGVLGGINYQFFPTNGLTPNSSILVQSPKIFVDQENSTIVSFIYYTVNPHESETAKLFISLRDENGNEVYSTHKEIRARGTHFEIFEEKMNLKGWYTLFAVCPNRSLVPITFLVNPNKSITVDHSMPPVAYSTDWNGPKRARSVDFVYKNIAKVAL